jgi:hypothetical protein
MYILWQSWTLWVYNWILYLDSFLIGKNFILKVCLCNMHTNNKQIQKSSVSCPLNVLSKFNFTCFHLKICGQQTSYWRIFSTYENVDIVYWNLSYPLSILKVIFLKSNPLRFIETFNSFIRAYVYIWTRTNTIQFLVAHVIFNGVVMVHFMTKLNIVSL